MKVLLIFNKGCSTDYKVLVELHTEELIARVYTLMEDQREQEAFDLIFSRAKVVDFIPAGDKRRIKPAMLLVEDIL